MDRPTSTPTDHELALRVRDGQDWAFEELLRRHGDLIGAHTQLIDGAPGESHEDFVQAARIGLLKAARTYSASRGAGFRYFASIAIRAELVTALVTARRGKHNVLNNSQRFEEPVEKEMDLVIGEVVPAPEHEGPLETLIRQEELHELVEGVMRCSPREREAVAWVLNGKPYTDHKWVDNGLQRARRKLAA